MKKYICLTLALIMSMAFSACGYKAVESSLLPGSTSDDWSIDTLVPVETDADKTLAETEAPEPQYYYIDSEGKVGLPDYHGIEYADYEVKVSDEELNKQMDDTLAYFKTFMEVDELTDEIVDEFYDEYATVDELKAAISDIILNQNQLAHDTGCKEEILESLTSKADFFADLTEESAESYKSLLAHYNVLAVSANLSFDDYITQELNTTREELEKQLAADAVKLTYRKTVLLAVAEAEKLEVSDEEYEKRVRKYMEYYGYSNAEVFEEEYTKDYIVSNMLQDLALEFLYENGKGVIN